MKKLNEMIEEAEALDDNFKISKDILLIRLKDCKEELEKQLTLTDVVSCVCKIPEPRLKVSENGTHAYCNNCAKTYLQK